MSETNLAERRKAAQYADKMCGMDQTTKAWNDCFYRRLDTLIQQSKANQARIASGQQKKRKKSLTPSKVAFNIAYSDNYKPKCNGFDQVNSYYEKNHI